LGVYFVREVSKLEADFFCLVATLP